MNQPFQISQDAGFAVLRSDALALPVSEICLVGEFTTQSGPYDDDWFLVLAHRDGRWLELSMYGEGEQVRQQLASLWACPLQVGLANSTDFASRIIWPLALAGRPLFTFERVTGRSFLRCLQTLFIPEIAHRLSLEALSATIPSA